MDDFKQELEKKKDWTQKVNLINYLFESNK